MKKFIKVKFQFEGFHQWPGALNHEEKYLALLHRHIFHCTAVKEVSHNDRDIEFIQLKRQMSNWLKDEYGNNFGFMSCEAIAEMLIKRFDLDECEVMEDNENGAIVRRTE